MSSRSILLSLLRPFSLGAFTMLLASCATPDTRAEADSAEESAAVFARTVKPLFEQRCVWCHGGESAQGGLNLQDRAGTLGSPRRFIVPGNAPESAIYRALTLDAAHPRVMPGDGWGITKEQASALRAWIDGGAPWPEGAGGRVERKPLRVDRDDFL